jgi:hypothetical protein
MATTLSNILCQSSHLYRHNEVSVDAALDGGQDIHPKSGSTCIAASSIVRERRDLDRQNRRLHEPRWHVIPTRKDQPPPICAISSKCRSEREACVCRAVAEHASQCSALLRRRGDFPSSPRSAGGQFKFLGAEGAMRKSIGMRANPRISTPVRRTELTRFATTGVAPRPRR